MFGNRQTLQFRNGPSSEFAQESVPVYYAPTGQELVKWKASPSGGGLFLCQTAN